MIRFTALVVLVLAALSGPATGILRAQQLDTAAVRILLEQRLGRSVTQDEILEGLRQSGMSRAEAAARLRQLGYDPAVVDPYYDQLEQAAPGRGAGAADDFVSALSELGIARPGQAPEARGDGAVAAAAADTLPGDTAETDTLPYFGRSLFSRATTQFQPVTTGPVGPGYRLGPGDELVLVLTGDVELVHSLTVVREGYVVIPDVGQLFVGGLTLAELEDRLYDRLGRVYSGVRRGPEATTRFHVSLGRLRTNQVYVIGEVERPGAYEVSSVATVFNALYAAGGPTVNGSFRAIQVRREGELVEEVDLYEYLLRGDSRSDVRLEHGDIVFVPMAERRVSVRGAVRRPAIYEVGEADGLRQLIAYAGGFQPEAFVRRVQIDRILSPAERRPGVERVLIDVDVQELLDEQGAFIPLRAGDAVEVFVVSEARRNRVLVGGEVRRPGTYEWEEGMTLWDLIDRAEGLDERAYTPRAHIFRLNEEDGSRRLLRTPLLADSAGRAMRDVLLTDRDSVIIYSREVLRNPAFVTIDGFVKNPGRYALAEGMTLKDLVLAAGGFIDGANTTQADVARVFGNGARSDTTSYVLRIPLDSVTPAGSAAAELQPAGDSVAGSFAYDPGRTGARPGDVPLWVPSADEFELQHRDHIFIRKAPGYEPARTVVVTGEVMLPGTYVLETRQERLSDLLVRAGGLTNEAYAPGLQVVRGGALVATDLERALADPAGRYNLVLEAGDSVHVPALDPTVVVTGAVNFESRVLYRPGAGLDYYIEQAGGYTERADRGRVTVTYQNGEREAVDRFLLLFSSKPEPGPGSTIVVPEVPPSQAQGFDLDQFLTRTTSIVTSLIAVILAIDRVAP